MKLENANPWWLNEPDPVLSEWNSHALKWTPAIATNLARYHLQGEFGLHFLTGPRQVGKTTALHLFIHSLLEHRVDPNAICYFQCDELLDFRELGDAIDAYLMIKKSRHIEHSALLFDEITFVKDWWRAVKARLDNKVLSNDTIIVTGSASLDLLVQKERFPGRRGNGLDVTLYPLDFHQYASLHVSGLVTSVLAKDSAVDTICMPNKLFTNRLDELFIRYLITGGFPAPIHEYNRAGTISQATRGALLAWIKGDTQLAGKSNAYMKEVLQYLLTARNSPISWLSIAKNTSIRSPTTVVSYVDLLERLLLAKTLHLLDQQQHVAYKRNKKVHFTDPFISRVLAGYTGVDLLDEDIVESIVATHLARKYPTYYWKDGSEIDAIALIDKVPVGFEVKYGNKQWKRVLHLSQQHLLNKPIIPTFLASVEW
nr:ATP-binding protein [Candidatus Sigynarchaeum springense]